MHRVVGVRCLLPPDVCDLPGVHTGRLCAREETCAIEYLCRRSRFLYYSSTAILGVCVRTLMNDSFHCKDGWAMCMVSSRALGQWRQDSRVDSGVHKFPRCPKHALQLRLAAVSSWAEV